MKNLLLALTITGIFVLFGYAISDGVDREVKRQCIVAKDNCEKYSEAGACSPKYLAICEGVEDDER